MAIRPRLLGVGRIGQVDARPAASVARADLVVIANRIAVAAATARTATVEEIHTIDAITGADNIAADWTGPCCRMSKAVYRVKPADLCAARNRKGAVFACPKFWPTDRAC